MEEIEINDFKEHGVKQKGRGGVGWFFFGFLLFFAI